MSTPTIVQHIDLNLQNNQKLYQIPLEKSLISFFQPKKILKTWEIGVFKHQL